MNHIRLHRYAAVWGVLLALCSAHPALCALEKQDARMPASETAAPPFSSMGEAQMTVVIDDVRGLVDRGRKLLQGIMPEAGDAMLRKQLGRLVSNVKLQGLEEGKGVAVLVFPKGVKVAFVEVSAEKADGYASALGRKGAIVGRADGMLIVAQRDDVVTAGMAIVREVREKLLGSNRTRGIRAEIPVARLLGKYDTQIRSSFKAASAVMRMRQQMAAARKDSDSFVPTTATMNMLELELRLVYRMLRKLDKLQVAVDLPAEGIRLDLAFVPLAGDDTATSAARATKSAAKILKLMPARGAMRIAMAADPRTFGSFIEKELGTALDETGMDSVTREGMMKLVRDWMAVAGDASAADLVIPGKALVSGSTVVEIRDSAAFLKLVEGLPAQIRESGIDKLYADMGIPMKVEVSMNVRQENGIPVHRLTFRTDAEGASGPAAAIAKTVMGDGIVYDFAVVDGHAVYALGGESVGDLIDAVKAGAHPDARPAAAEAVFGPDASFYCDYNIGKLIEVMAGILPKAGLPDKAVKTIRDTADALSGAPPLAIAGFSEGRTYRLSLMVPAELLGKIVQAGRAARDARVSSALVDTEETTATAPAKESPEN